MKCCNVPFARREVNGTTLDSETLEGNEVRNMQTNYSKLSIAVALVIAGSFLMIPVQAMAPECHSDQRQLQNNVGMNFGGKTVLAQTFVPSAAGLRLCKVKVTIRKNVAAGGAVTLRLLNAAFGPVADPVTIPVIPMGVSVQVFDLGCDDAPLGAAQYAIQLESPNSPLGAYSWRGAGGNPYARPANSGKGWRNLNAGNPANWNNLGLWDFAFDIYVCD